jgi:hypothetical protein
MMSFNRLDLDKMIIDDNSPFLNIIPDCKGELMIHQNKLVRAIIDFENSDYVNINHNKLQIKSYTNRIMLMLKMGMGKTKTAIGVILSSPVPKLKPIYFCDTSSGVSQKRIFTEDKCILPTFIIVNNSVFNQWLDQITEFCNLRVCKVFCTKSTISFVKHIMSDLDGFNKQYDIILVNCKSVSGNMNYVLDLCDNLFEEMSHKSKRINTILFNVLNKYCIRRIIYDDWDMLSIKISPLENACSCIYMSATSIFTCSKSNVSYVKYDPNESVYNYLNSNFKITLSNSGYKFNNKNIKAIPHIEVDDKFLNNSISIGLSEKSLIRMPALPIVKICHVQNTENVVINIINELTSDEKIMESVNSMESSSPSCIIQSLLSKRFNSYRKALRLIEHYNPLFISNLVNLPEPPLGSCFTRDNIEALDEIIYRYKDIENRITYSIETAKEFISKEEKMFERIRARISDNSCPICLEEIQKESSGIMFCCNAIIHVSCAMRCIKPECPICRASYGKTFSDTFVCLHHSINIDDVLLATSVKSILTVVPNSIVDIKKITKFTILKDILLGQMDNIKQTDIDLIDFKSLSFDRNSDMKCSPSSSPIKALISCSSDNTLTGAYNILSEFMEVSILTPSSSQTYKKINAFKNAITPSAILSNLYKNSAGIDLRYATMVIFLNIIEQKFIMQQMIGRVLRLNQRHRPIIYLISFDNETNLWLKHYNRN